MNFTADSAHGHLCDDDAAPFHAAIRLYTVEVTGMIATGKFAERKILAGRRTVTTVITLKPTSPSFFDFENDAPNKAELVQQSRLDEDFTSSLICSNGKSITVTI